MNSRPTMLTVNMLQAFLVISSRSKSCRQKLSYLKATGKTYRHSDRSVQNIYPVLMTALSNITGKYLSGRALSVKQCQKRSLNSHLLVVDF